MFHRGQKVVITESSVKHRAHPAIGDKGYIENMFLFPDDRFILMSLIMCSYKKGGARSEHKKFILDLGMSDVVKHKIEQGVNKLYFLSKNSINLLPAFIYKNKVNTVGIGKYDQMVSFPQIVGTYGMWTNYTKTQKRKRINKDMDVIIPYGHIRSCECGQSIRNLPLPEVNSWIRSILPNIVSVVTLFNHINRGDDGGGNLVDRANDIFANIRFLFDLDSRVDSIHYFKIKQDILKQTIAVNKLSLLMLLHALSHTAIVRLLKKVLNTVTDISIANIAFLFSNGRINELLNIRTLLDDDIKVLDGKLVVEAFYMSLFINKNTKVLLESIKECLPRQWDIDLISEAADVIKSDVKSGSAALHRLFEIINVMNKSSIREDVPDPVVVISKDYRENIISERYKKVYGGRTPSSVNNTRNNTNKVIKRREDTPWVVAEDVVEAEEIMTYDPRSND